ncbi:MAG: hypothetical protein QXO27_03495 [Candidatus Aenigmatarchaeota archaeon]
MKPPYNLIEVLSHQLKRYCQDTSLSLRFGLKSFDIHLDDLCARCNEVYYCNKCDKDCRCQYKTVEECPEIPCLDCTVYKIRKFFGMEVKGTIGTNLEKTAEPTNCD